MAKDKKLVEAITAMEDDFAQWYTDVVKKAELADYSSVRGCMILRPNGYAIWENIQKVLDAKFKETGVENVAMPMFIPESLLKKEEDKKVINIVNISDIKLYNNKVQVHQKNTEVYIQTIKNNFTIKFDNAIEAVKFVTKVTDAVTGTTISDRGVKKVKNAFDKVDDILGFDTRGTVKGVIENGITGTLLKRIKRKNK